MSGDDRVQVPGLRSFFPGRQDKVPLELSNPVFRSADLLVAPLIALIHSFSPEWRVWPASKARMPRDGRTEFPVNPTTGEAGSWPECQLSRRERSQRR